MLTAFKSIDKLNIKNNKMKYTKLVLSLILVMGLGFGGCKNYTKKVVRIWHTESDANAKKAFQRIVDKYEKIHPNVKIEWEAISWGALSEKLTIAMATGEEPDITHLEPFMVASLYSKGLLEPIDDVFNVIGDDIFPAVKDLQKFGNKHYGIAYAIGTTYYSYRSDWANKKDSKSLTWDEYIKMLNEIKNKPGAILPGGSSFFMDQLFAETVACNGGRLFDDNGKPTFTEKQVIESLNFIKKISKTCSKDWTNIGYQEQFIQYAAGKGFSVPVTYARASKQIDKSTSKNIDAPNSFSVMEQPIGPSGKKSYATIDCEPWVIFKSSKVKKEAKDFLKFFYKKDNYIDFCSQVPIHLNPIFKSMAYGDTYQNLPFVKKWHKWEDLSLKMISSERVKPILLVEDNDKKLPFLMELQGSRIITDMIFDVAVNNEDPMFAAKKANMKAEKLIEKLGYKKW